MATVEEWRALGAKAILALLSAEGAATQRGMEAKLADARYPGTKSAIHPHHLTTARNRLLAAGAIERLQETTKGGSTVVTFMLADPSKAVLRIAARKRLLDARYRSWTRDGEWGAAPIPIALERVIHNSLVTAAPHGYRLLRPDGGEVRQIAGQAVPGGPLDNAVYYTVLGPGGLPAGSLLMPIEAKNLRQWIYPRTQELYQLLDKAARLRGQHPQLPITPVLVCRRTHYDTALMAKQLGFHVISTWRQYVRPAVTTGSEGRRKFEEVNTELGYNLDLHEGSIEPMVNHFTDVIPARCVEASDRWAQYVAHPDVPKLFARMRADTISNHDRHTYLSKLAAAAQEVFGEDAEWFRGHDHGEI